MGRYILRRLVLAVVTLWLLATMVFFLVNVLPSNVGRQILGPFAPPEQVRDYNHKLGTDRPLLVQYGQSMKHLFTFDFGRSYQTQEKVVPKLWKAMFRSSKLAGLALLLTVPVSIVAGVIAGRRRDTLVDRAIVLTGLATASVPEFVTGAILSIIIGVQLKLLPVLSIAPDGAGPITQLRYLLLPAISMAIVYFGYIARMARAGTIDSLDSDYARTAIMKGLSERDVMRKHILRNALLPTITVIGVQIGYLFGGLIGVERIFSYPGMGQTIFLAATQKDIPVLQAGVIMIGLVYMLATLAADLLIAWLNPRTRLELERST